MTVTRIIAANFAFILCFCASLRADTVILKSGEKVEGKILSETDTEVTMSVQVTATIKDDRIIKREEIEKISKVQPDEEAWAVVANVMPGTDSLERDEYDRVTAALSYFTGTFPKSPHVALAQSRLDEFTSEQVRVGLGDVKLNGQWLGKEKVQEERVQIAGRILLNRMKRAAGAGQLTDAMASFDQMEKNFAGSASYAEAVELGRRILPSLKVAIEQRQTQLKQRAEDEKQRLTRAKGADHELLVSLIKKETAATEATLAAIEHSGVKWLPLQPANTRSLTALATRVTAETTRLNGLPTEKMKESIKAAEEAAEALALGNLIRAESKLKDASTAWPANELVKRTQLKLTEAKKAAPPGKTGASPQGAAPTPPPKPKPSLASRDAAGPAAPAAPEEPAEPPFFKRPAFLIGLAAVVAFGAIAGKMIAKSRAASADDALDK